jgi:hypothetical protein
MSTEKDRADDGRSAPCPNCGWPNQRAVTAEARVQELEATIDKADEHTTRIMLDVERLDALWSDATVRALAAEVRMQELERENAQLSELLHAAVEDYNDELNAKRELEREVARLKGAHRPDTHEYGCPRDGEIKTEPCADCERALREIHPSPDPADFDEDGTHRSHHWGALACRACDCGYLHPDAKRPCTRSLAKTRLT